MPTSTSERIPCQHCAFSTSAAPAPSAPSCVTESIRQGHDVTILNRGRQSPRPRIPMPGLVNRGHPRSGLRPAPPSATRPSTRRAASSASPPITCSDRHRPVPAEGRQYVFISSASAYQTPPTPLPVTRVDSVANPSAVLAGQDRRARTSCRKTYRDVAFPITIVRPSHTYDDTSIVFDGGWTLVDRMRRGSRGRRAG